jgi:hypothetical protein
VPLELGDRTVTVVDHLVVEEVEQLVTWLRATDRPRVNLRRCTGLHTGALQALILLRPRISSPPADPFLAEHLMPLIEDRVQVPSATGGEPL